MWNCIFTTSDAAEKKKNYNISKPNSGYASNNHLTFAGADLGEGPKGPRPPFCLGFFFKQWLLNRAENALLLPFVHKDIAFDYGAIVDDYAKRNQRRITLINPLQ